MTTASAPSLRLFLGIWPPAGTLSALQQHAALWPWPASARRSAPERLHVTLHFLGNVDAQLLPRLRQGLGVPWRGCELVLDRAQLWPGGIAVLEAAVVPDPLAQLHKALAERLLQLGVALETRRYRPHVTLARKAFGVRPPSQFEPVRWRAEPGYLLVQSLPGGGGYAPLQRFA